VTELLWRALAEWIERVAATYEPSQLHAMPSAGSLLVPEGFGFVHADSERGPRLSPSSRGTDIASCPAFGDPVLPEPRA
jgi:hypothetical protein